PLGATTRKGLRAFSRSRRRITLNFTAKPFPAAAETARNRRLGRRSCWDRGRLATQLVVPPPRRPASDERVAVQLVGRCRWHPNRRLGTRSGTPRHRADEVAERSSGCPWRKWYCGIRPARGPPNRTGPPPE